MSPERAALLERAKTLAEDLKTAAENATEEEDADRLWQAFSQAGDVVEELLGIY